MKKINLLIFSVLVLVLLLCKTSIALSQTQAEIDKYTAGKEERLKSLNDAKFGMFIHWGPYAQLAGEWNGKRVGGLGEWIMWVGKIPIKDYEAEAKKFNPLKFNADEWAKLAKDAGMKYVVITAKHCDGFAMYKSNVSAYNMVDFTPFKRDVCKELETACNKQNVKLGFYYSHWWDWHEEHSIAGPMSGKYYDNSWNFPDRSKKQADIYIDGKALPQVNELVSNYQPYAIWFDVPQGISREQSFKFLKTIRSANPQIIINDRIGNDMGDYSSPEQYIPNGTSVFEVCMTMNDTWGYKYYDHNWKSAKTVIQNLADIAHKGGNYLLNVGPTPEGIIPPASVRILQDVGKWMKANGECIYGTTASPLGKLPFSGRCTAKPGKLFIHIFDWPQNREIVIPGLQSKVSKVYLLADPKHQSLSFIQKEQDLLVNLVAEQLPAEAFCEYNTVMVIEYEGELKTLEKPILVDPSSQVYLSPDVAKLSGKNVEYKFYDTWGNLEERGYHVYNWNDLDASLSWKVRTIRTGAYEVYLKYGAPKGCEQNSFTVTIGDQTINGKVQDTDGWYKYQSVNVGQIKLEKSDDLTLTIKPTQLGSCSLMNLKEVKLIPIIR